MGRIWAVCSGSGGVGKSTIALALAAGAAKAGKQTVLLDASGLARSCDLILGLQSVVVLDMMDVISGQTEMDSALYPVSRYEKLRFACASLYDEVAVSELAGAIIALNSKCDVLVIDLPTGRAEIGRGIMCRDDWRILITRPDDASIRATERLMINADDGVSAGIVINRMNRIRNRRGTQYGSDAVQSILDCPVIGRIPEDPSIPASEQKGHAAIECDGPSWNALKELLQELLSGA